MKVKGKINFLHPLTTPIMDVRIYFEPFPSMTLFFDNSALFLYP